MVGSSPSKLTQWPLFSVWLPMVRTLPQHGRNNKIAPLSTPSSVSRPEPLSGSISIRAARAGPFQTARQEKRRLSLDDAPAEALHGHWCDRAIAFTRVSGRCKGRFLGENKYSSAPPPSYVVGLTPVAGWGGRGQWFV